MGIWAWLDLKALQQISSMRILRQTVLAKNLQEQLEQALI
jgi:hypothetical protein